MSILVVMSALVAGCIQAPEESEAGSFEPASAPPPADRIDGMTAEGSHQDEIVPCEENNGDPLIEFPRVCAQRAMNVTGRIGVDMLPVELISTSGAVTIEHSEGDAWSLFAVYRVEAMTEDMARSALDTAWTWSHEDAAGGHALRAGPSATEGAVITMGVSPTARVTITEYHVTLPEWVTLDLKAVTDNGQIVVRGYDMEKADLETDNGQIVLAGSVGDLRLHTDNGGVAGAITPRESATWDLQTDNGQIVLDMPEGARYGYDIVAKVDNGQVIIGLQDGKVSRGEDSVSFKTTGYDARAIQVKVGAEVDNGQVILGE